MAEYKITRVSSQPPREHYSDKFKMTTYYIKVQLGGHPKPVSVGKRSPTALKAGDTIYGTIIPTEFDTDNFKTEQKQNPSFATRDQGAIRAQWAIGQAVTLFTTGKDSNITDIEKNAHDFFAMVDRIKSPTEQQSGYEKAKAQAEKIRPSFADGSPIPENIDTDEPINLDDIPF